ncbi:MAG TPA: YtxH domain-containing protein [Ktedonobacterales bacterium]|jgi:gas vesicle protein|nr:YtxH domain-containing protein [Ktedonobacterales bacterium]
MRTIRAFFWGTAIGAMLGLLFAPQRGDVTRSQVQERLGAWQDQAQTQVSSIKSKTNQLIDQGRKTTKSVLRQASDATDTASASMQDAVSRTGTMAE